MDQGSEELLILLAIDLDHYYDRLVTMYEHQLKAFVLRRIGSLQDAEDIVQDAFLRAYQALERYPAQQIQTLKVRAWLYKIAWSVYCNFTGRSKQPPSISLDASEEGDVFEREDDREKQPEVIFEHTERRKELEVLVSTLPQNYRDVVSLYFFEELSYQEIAEVLNQAVGTVRVYVHRGLRLLRKTLEQQINEVV